MKILKLHFVILLIGIIYYIWYRFTHIGIPCVFHSVTGLYCPGCGVTRMLLALSEFRLADAFHNNGMVLLLLPYGAFVYIRHNVYLMKGQSYPYKKAHKYIAYVILFIVLLFGVIRNIPYFEYLRPL